VLFRDIRTGVEVNVVTPAAIHVPVEVAEEVARTTMLSDDVQVASEAGLVALKLVRLSYQDQAHIVAIIKTGGIDLSGFLCSARLPSLRLSHTAWRSAAPPLSVLYLRVVVSALSSHPAGNR
jgi:hypothetical protein